MENFPATQSAYWIQGPAQSGKTTRLIRQFLDWQDAGKPDVGQSDPGQSDPGRSDSLHLSQGPRLLLFAATGDNRIELVNRLTEVSGGQYPIQSTTPLAFFELEVSLFWPLLIQKLDLKPRFPLRLRPETEQELATRLWQRELTQGPLSQEGVSEWRIVRRILDLYLLASSARIPIEQLSSVLQRGMPPALGSPELWAGMGAALLRWRNWCLERGLITYGLLSELYGQSLLPDPTYQAQLHARYEGILADDVDEYPAIAHPLFEQFIHQKALTLFTYNPEGAVRLGFGADPDVLQQLQSCCQVEMLSLPSDRLAMHYAPPIVQLVRDAGLGGGALPSLVIQEADRDMIGEAAGEAPREAAGDVADANEPEPSHPFRSIETMARSQLLRAVAAEIVEGVRSGVVEPQEIAVVGPGVDAIARYTLMEILSKHQIQLEPLTEQRPLQSAPMVRALLTLLAFVYPGLGRLLDPDQVAEMLVVLSLSTHRATDGEEPHQPIPRIDAVRAGLLADHCYVPDPEEPKLLGIEAFPRWDRLGYEASTAYNQLLTWLEVQKLQRSQRLIASPLVVLDRAIQAFLWNGSTLAYDQLAALRELLEAAQHYWEVEARLTSDERDTSTIERFIRLLQGGTITANPYPVQPLTNQAQAVTLATFFQYRINRSTHRWQFWLDAGSPLWLTSSGTSLFGAHLFTQVSLADLETAKAQTHARASQMAQERLENGLRDLLGHSRDRIYICTSELATNGQPQLGPLLSLGVLSTEASIP